MEMIEFCMSFLLYIVIYSGDSPVRKSEPLFSVAVMPMSQTNTSY